MGYSYDLFLRNSSIFVDAQNAEAVTRIFADAGYETDVDSSGNIVGCNPDGSGIVDDDTLYEALAPFMRDGSFLEICNEMGDNWRRVFAGGSCKRVSAIVVWPNPEAPPDIAQRIYEAFTQHLMADQ